MKTARLVATAALGLALALAACDSDPKPAAQQTCSDGSSEGDISSTFYCRSGHIISTAMCCGGEIKCESSQEQPVSRDDDGFPSDGGDDITYDHYLGCAERK